MLFCFLLLSASSRLAEDEKGLDEKVLAVPDKDPRFNHMTSLRDVPEHVLREITNFFEVNKRKECIDSLHTKYEGGDG